MDKKKVPSGYIEDNFWNIIYFGDNKAQQRAIGQLKKGLQDSKGKIYLLAGAARTGKGTVFDNATQQLNDADDNINYIDQDNYPLSDYDPTESIHNVIVDADNELDSIASKISWAKDYIGEHPNSSIVIEVLLHEPPLPGTQTAQHGRLLTVQRKQLADISKENDISLIRTHHDIEQVKKSLWNLREKLLKRGFSSNAAADGIRQSALFESSNQNPDVTAVINGLAEGDKVKYDLAFQRFQLSPGYGSPP